MKGLNKAPWINKGFWRVYRNIDKYKSKSVFRSCFIFHLPCGRIVKPPWHLLRFNITIAFSGWPVITVWPPVTTSDHYWPLFDHQWPLTSDHAWKRNYTSRTMVDKNFVSHRTEIKRCKKGQVSRPHGKVLGVSFKYILLQMHGLIKSWITNFKNCEDLQTIWHRRQSVDKRENVLIPDKNNCQSW